MHLKGNILTNSQYKHFQKTKFGFFKKIQIQITVVIISVLFVIGIIVYLGQYNDFKHQLESQGKELTRNLAFNAEKFIIDYDKNELNKLLDGILVNQSVLFGGIINARFTDPAIEVLRKQPFIDLKFVAKLIRWPNYNKMQASDSIILNSDDNTIGKIIFCITPIISDLKFPDDEATLLYNQEKHRGVIGYSIIAYKLPWDQIFTMKTQWLIGIYSLAALFLAWVIGQIVTKYWTNRLRLIYEATHQYSFGSIIEINDPKNDEVTGISNAIEDMSKMVQLQLEKINQININLNHTVEERTKELFELNEKIEIRTNTQRIFIAQIIQELKTLIGIISEIMLNPANTKIGPFIQHIEQLVDVAIQIIRQKSEIKLPLNAQSVSVNSMILDLNDLFELMCSKNNNQFSIKIEKDLHCICDELQLKQSIIQVISNATKPISDLNFSRPF